MYLYHCTTLPSEIRLYFGYRPALRACVCAYHFFDVVTLNAIRFIQRFTPLSSVCVWSAFVDILRCLLLRLPLEFSVKNTVVWVTKRATTTNHYITFILKCWKPIGFRVPTGPMMWAKCCALKKFLTIVMVMIWPPIFCTTHKQRFGKNASLKLLIKKWKGK